MATPTAPLREEMFRRKIQSRTNTTHKTGKMTHRPVHSPVPRYAVENHQGEPWGSAHVDLVGRQTRRRADRVVVSELYVGQMQVPIVPPSTPHVKFKVGDTECPLQVCHLSRSSESIHFRFLRRDVALFVSTRVRDSF